MMVVYSDRWGCDATMLQPIVSQWVVTALDESVVGRTGHRDRDDGDDVLINSERMVLKN